jgi:hypothetical protein
MKIYKMICDDNGEVEAIALTEAPAIGVEFIAFSNERKKIYFNEERRIIVSPLLIPNQLIYRYSEDIGDYFVTIDASEVEKVAGKLFGKQIYINYEHESKKFDNVNLISVFFSDASIGIAAPEYFSKLPEKTLYIALKVLNDEAWEMIKQKEVIGVSIEGFFTLKSDESDEQKAVAASDDDISEEEFEQLKKMFEV